MQRLSHARVCECVFGYVHVCWTLIGCQDEREREEPQSK